MPKERLNLESLDALRGLAILNVILVHAVYWGPRQLLLTRWPFLNATLLAGQRGVQLFFIVSAFTLYMSAENRKEEHSPIRNFYLRRVFRLTPMFYVATVLGLAIWPEIMGNARQIVLSLLYLNNYSFAAIQGGAPGTWSISTEAAFYLTLPLLVRYVKSPKQAGLLLVCYGLYRRLAFSFIVPHYDPGTRDFWLFMSYPANFGIFVFGILLYIVWRDSLRHWSLDKRKAWSLTLLGLAAALYLEHPPFDVETLFSGTLPFLALSAGLLLYPWKALVNRATVMLGKISYSFYLLHFCVAHLVEKAMLVAHPAFATEHGSALITVLAAMLLITTPLAYLTWRFIEEPGVALGRRWITFLEHRSVSPGYAEQQF